MKYELEKRYAREVERDVEGLPKKGFLSWCIENNINPILEI